MPDLAVLNDSQLLREGLQAVVTKCHTLALQDWQEQQLQQQPQDSRCQAKGDWIANRPTRGARSAPPNLIHVRVTAEQPEVYTIIL